MLYCGSNPSFPGILKIGKSADERTLLNRERDLFTTGVPTPFKIEFAKKVTEYDVKERKLHKLLEQYVERTHPRREFFRMSVEEVRAFFELMDGEWWIDSRKDTEDDESEEILDLDETDSAPQQKAVSVAPRDMVKCFVHGQRIRHTIGITKIWNASYNALTNTVLCNGVSYKSLSAFAMAHHRSENPSPRQSANGWAECEYEVNGEWKSTISL